MVNETADPSKEGTFFIPISLTFKSSYVWWNIRTEAWLERTNQDQRQFQFVIR